MKICTKCNIEQPLDLFHKDSSKNDGLRTQCKTCTKNGVITYNELHITEIKQRKQVHYNLNKETICSNMKTYYENNSATIKQRTSNYYQENKKEINTKEIKKRKLRYKTDKLFALKENIRTNLSKIFRSHKIRKTNKTLEILGCSFEDFKLHLEAKFEPWMNWNNYGLYNGELNYGWDIDHIIPVSTAVNESDIIRLNHWSNLQPLCSYTNRNIKRDSV